MEIDNRHCTIGNLSCGEGKPLLLIAGPCVLESEAGAFEIAAFLKRMVQGRPLGLVFKGSFDKANRTSGTAYRGTGQEEGLRILERIRGEFGVPVTTDIHESQQAAAVGEIVDLLQIPAFLCRQTDLLMAAAATGRAVNVKKGQFLAPEEMRHVVEKLRTSHCENMLLCERGTFFGYGRLVNDFRSLPVMQRFGVPVIFDATHSVQLPGGLGDRTGGQRELVAPLARAAVAVGTDGLFLETHPDPEKSPSDGPNMIPLAELPKLIDGLLRIREAVRDK
jgi:2-dehydro-3-deoxyphosphooctonate aldolase (KDO 8-P synthase)